MVQRPGIDCSEGRRSATYLRQVEQAGKDLLHLRFRRLHDEQAERASPSGLGAGPMMASVSIQRIRRDVTVWSTSSHWSAAG